MMALQGHSGQHFYAELNEEDHGTEETCFNCRWCGCGAKSHVGTPPCECPLGLEERARAQRSYAMGYGHVPSLHQGD